MSIVGNIIWFVFGGIFSGLCWYVVGLLWCLTFIGIPVGLQCFKLGRLSFFPFGKNITLSNKTSSILLNILWLIFGGIELALAHVSIGLGFCVIYFCKLIYVFFCNIKFFCKFYIFC